MKVSYANMKLKVNTAVNTFEFCGQTIEVLQYLPAQDKYDLLMVTLQKSIEEGAYNDFKLDVYFNLNLVYMYTNISFTDKQREDEFKIYDCLKSNGFFEAFFEALEDSEYNELFDQLNEIKEASTASRQSAAAILNRFIDDLPKQAAAAQNIVDNFNPERYKEVIKFANFANGGRDFRTNQPVTE